MRRICSAVEGSADPVNRARIAGIACRAGCVGQIHPEEVEDMAPVIGAKVLPLRPHGWFDPAQCKVPLLARYDIF